MPNLTVHNFSTANYVHVGAMPLSGIAPQTVIPPGGSAVITDSSIEHFTRYGALAMDKIKPGYRGLAYQE